MRISKTKIFSVSAVVALAGALLLSSQLSASAISATGFSVEETSNGVTVFYQGKLFTRYVIGEGNKPFLWPVIGPTGKRMTRAYPMEDVPEEKQDHPHHRSVWFGHQEMDGFDTWHEPLSYTIDPKKAEKYRDRMQLLGPTVHREFKEVSAGADHAVIVTVNDYLDADGNKIMEDARKFTFRAGDDARTIDFDLTLTATREVTLGAAKDAGVSVRVAHSMCVDAGEGGRIVNSEGQTDKEAWGQRAPWCDFHGPVEGETLGVAILNHPSSFRHPTAWHARTYGLFTANPFLAPIGSEEEKAANAVVMKPGDQITLRHRIIFHQGDAKGAGIAEAFEKYANEK